MSSVIHLLTIGRFLAIVPPKFGCDCIPHVHKFVQGRTGSNLNQLAISFFFISVGIKMVLGMNRCPKVNQERERSEIRVLGESGTLGRGSGKEFWEIASWIKILE